MVEVEGMVKVVVVMQMVKVEVMEMEVVVENLVVEVMEMAAVVGW